MANIRLCECRPCCAFRKEARDDHSPSFTKSCFAFHPSLCHQVVKNVEDIVQPKSGQCHSSGPPSGSGSGKSGTVEAHQVAVQIWGDFPRRKAHWNNEDGGRGRLAPPSCQRDTISLLKVFYKYCCSYSADSLLEETYCSRNENRGAFQCWFRSHCVFKLIKADNYDWIMNIHILVSEEAKF